MWGRMRKTRLGSYLTLVIGLVVLGVFSRVAFAEDNWGCLPLEPPMTGPFDYRTPPANDMLHVVEKYHFSPQVEALVRGVTAATVGPDLAYVLSHFPNHHRALATLVRLAKRDRTHRPLGMERSIECYFDLALRFAPNDGVVHLLYGVWLTEAGDKKGAEAQLTAAQASVPSDNPNAQYNLGLGWFALGRYDEALAAAHAAYGMGYQLPGLRQKLEKVGKWQALPRKSAISAESGSAEEKVAPPGAEGLSQ